jgi:hypothetical protein
LRIDGAKNFPGGIAESNLLLKPGTTLQFFIANSGKGLFSALEYGIFSILIISSIFLFL